ncbi:MAG: hypothetical protein JXP73_08400 [Deltaproteobacteria bacterium]|nr:hypothetical protein [Deltaproteobacteria bacterium]
MRLAWALPPCLAACIVAPCEARAADVAVMPVKGVNLTEGEADAIGVLFANALAREARVAVVPPLQSRKLRAEGKTSVAIAQELGATNYIELSALQLERKIVLAGFLCAQDGTVLFRAETSAASLDATDVALARLAKALVYRRPVFAAPALPGEGEAAPAAYEAPSPPPDPNASRGSYGPKAGIAIPRSSGRTFSPSISIQFDGRYGPRSHFLEFGAGLLIPADDSYSTSGITVSSGFLEFGGSYYLWPGNAAMYVGGGVSPAIWQTRYDYGDEFGATCSVYGQVGVTFTRDLRAKIYAEFRLSQLLLAVADPGAPGGAYGETFRPMVLAFQGGVGF